jgi:hypothetical protein
MFESMSYRSFVRRHTAFVLLVVNIVTAQATLVLNDPLQGSTLGTRAGGTFVTGGWQVTGQTDSIYWHVSTITNGAAEFDVRGLYPNECRAGMEDKVELFHMYDYTWNNADTSYAPGYRDDPYKHFIRKTGCLDTARVNSMEIVWQILPNFHEPDTAQLSWDPNTTYHFREEWGPDGAGNSVLRLYRDGTLLLTTSVPGSWNPAGHSVRIAASTRRAPDFGAPIGAVFSNVKVWNLSIGAPGAPSVTEPANNATLNTRSVFVQWNGDAHARYEVRINRANDPNSGIAWSSGEVNSDRNFAWVGPLDDMTQYYVFVRLSDSSSTWGPWNASGRTFHVNSTVVPGGTNLVRVNGRSLRDNNGPFLGLGASYFQALRRAKYDRARFTNDLAFLASKKMNYVRTLSMVGWYEAWQGLEIAPVSFVNRVGTPVAAWPDYWQQFLDMIDIIYSFGMRAQVTIFADAQLMPNKSARIAHMNTMLQNLAGREHKVILLEVANEAWQNGFPGDQGVADLREFAQYLNDRTEIPVAITSNHQDSFDSLYAGSAADIATWHFSRDIGTVEGGWLPVRDCYTLGNLTGRPAVSSNEPIGPGSSVSSENDPIKLVTAAVFAWTANLPMYVYHTSAGVFGHVTFESMAGAGDYVHLHNILPPDLSSWVRNDGLEATAPFTVFCNGQANKYWPDVSSPTSGCDRNIGSAKGKEFICVPMGILSGGLTLQARRPVSFQAVNPLTGEVYKTYAIGTGAQITLPQGPGAYILKGTFLDNVGATTHTLNVKPATTTLTVDGNPADWNLAELTNTVRAGQGGTGDLALTGYDGGTLYYSGYYTGATLPTSAADHTARVYSRHDAEYLYLLVRNNDSDVRFPNPLSMNWANDCVEFYIDPAAARGSLAMNNSTSNVQLVIDANNQQNVYVCTPAYSNQVLSGVTSAVTRDASGWWLEARIAKTALDPDLLSAGATFGIDFNFHDNDNNNDTSQTTVYTWSDNVSGAGFPSKIPDKWGTAIAIPLEVSIDLGSPDIPNGITHPQNADGNTVAASIGGRSCRQTLNPNVDLYFYFGVSDAFAYQGNKQDLYVSVDYFDTGSGSLVLQYDSNTGNSLPAFYKDGGSVALTGSNTWKRKVFHVTDAYFGNRQNAGADFRIAKLSAGSFYLDLVRVVVPQPPPALRARSSGNAAVIAWPASSIGFVLQSQNSLSSSNWTDVTNTVVVIASENTVTDPFSNTNKFFRLKKF